MIKIQKLEKRHAAFVIVGFILFIALVIFLLIYSFNRNNDARKIDGYESGEGDHVEQSLIIKNYYQLTQTYGTNGAAAIRKQLQSIVFSPSELAAAVQDLTTTEDYKGYYDATLVESSFRLYSREPNVYTFTLGVADGRIYQVYARPCLDDNAESCYGVVAIRDGVVSFSNPAVSPEAISVLEAWRNQF